MKRLFGWQSTLAWAKRHKILASLAVLFVLGVAISSGNSSPQKSDASSSTTASAPKPTHAPKASPTRSDATESPSAAPSDSPKAAASPKPDADTLAARGWIHKSAHYTNEVQVAVQSVQASVALLQNSDASSSDTASLSGNIQQAHDFLDDASQFLVGVIDGHMKSQREQAWYAADELKDAMSKGRAYLDDQKPSELADFTSKFSDGVANWNEAITALYAKAGIPNPPTI